MVQGIEKRGAPRVEAPRVLLRIATLERLRTHFLKDLSEGGAFIRIAKPFSAGTTLTVELTCPGLDRPLRLSARVVRSVEASASAGDVGMAVRFEDADEQAKLKLRELVEKHLADDASQGGEVARLGAQVQTLIMELGASREALVASEKKAIEAAQRETAAQRELSEARLKGSQEAPLLRPTPLPFAVPADAGRIEVRRLRAELEEAGRRIASLEERHLSLETSEGTARQLLEKLAAERTRQKKQQAIDQARHATELAQLQAELESETARTQLERSGAEQAVQSAQEELARARKLFEFALKERLRISQEDAALVTSERDRLKLELGAAGTEAEEARAQLRQLTEQLAEKGQLLATAERRIGELTRESEELRRRERDLSRLLAALSTEPAEDVDLSRDEG